MFSPEPKRRAPWQWLSRLLLGALIVWALARGARDIPVGAALQKVPLQVLAGSVALYWAGQLVSAWRWQMLLNAIRPSENVPIDLRICVRWYGVGMFWNLWMPTGIGGDAARAIQAGNVLQSRSMAAASVLMDRLSGLVGLLVIGAIALLFDGASRGAHSAQAWRLIGIFSAFLISALLLFVFFNRFSNRKNPAQLSGLRAKISGILRSLQSALALYGAPQQRAVLWSSLLLSLIVQLIQIGINYGLARAVNLPLSVLLVSWLAPVLAVSSLVPLGIGGLGVREAAALALLGTQWPRGLVLAWSLLWQATVWLSSLCGAPWAFGVGAMKKTK